MKKIVVSTSKVILMYFIVIGASSFTPKHHSKTSETSLQVKVSGIKSATGDVHVLLFNNPTGFPDNPAKAYKHLKGKAIVGELILTMGKIPSGTYSIVAFHDKNSNDHFDKSWFGSPREDYGFSNIPNEFCGTPSFQQTSFIVNQSSNTVSVKLMNVK